MMGNKLPSWSKLITLLIALLLFVAPVTYAQGRWTGLMFGLIVGFLNGLGHRRNFVQGTAVGLVSGLSVGYSFSVGDSLLFGFLAAFLTGLSTTLANETETDSGRWVILIAIALVMGAFMGLPLLYVSGFAEGLPKLGALAIASTAGMPAGAVTGRWLRPKLLVFADVWIYIRTMGAYLIGFAAGYLALALLFSSWFWAVWKIDPQGSFNNLSPAPTFTEFLYFSVVTIATLGYGDITPKSGLTRALVSFEVALGVGWITVVFAAVMSHLQPRFAEIAKRQDRGQYKPRQ